MIDSIYSLFVGLGNIFQSCSLLSSGYMCIKLNLHSFKLWKLQLFQLLFFKWIYQKAQQDNFRSNLCFETATVLVTVATTSVYFRRYHLWQCTWHEVKHYNNSCHHSYKMFSDIVQQALLTQWIIKFQVCS